MRKSNNLCNLGNNINNKTNNNTTVVLVGKNKDEQRRSQEFLKSKNQNKEENSDIIRKNNNNKTDNVDDDEYVKDTVGYKKEGDDGGKEVEENECISIEDECEQDLVLVHELGQVLRREEIDSERFIEIYDNKIPSHFNLDRIKNIKEKSRQLADLDDTLFANSCSQLRLLLDVKDDHCDAPSSSASSNTTNKTMSSNLLSTASATADYESHLTQSSLQPQSTKEILKPTPNAGDEPTTTSTTTSSSLSASLSNKITFNQTFFDNQANALNPKFNPLLYKKQTKLEKITTNYTSGEIKLDESPKAKIEPSSSSSSFTLPPLTNQHNTTTTAASSISRDGFVTNQRYQTLKDNKRNESQLTHCCDEAYPVVAENNEDSPTLNSSSDEDSNTKSLTTSSSSSSSSSKASLTDSESDCEMDKENVVINMPSDEENYEGYGEGFGKEEKVDTLNGLTNKPKEKFESMVKKKDSESHKFKHKEDELFLNEDLVPSSQTSAVCNSVNKEKCENKYEEEEKLLKKYENECKYGHGFDLINSRSEKAQNLIKNLQKSTMSVTNGVKEENAEEKKRPLPNTNELPSSLDHSSRVNVDRENVESKQDTADALLSSVLNQLTLSQQSKDPPIPKSQSQYQFNNYTNYNIDDIPNLGLKIPDSNSSSATISTSAAWSCLNRDDEDNKTASSSSSSSSSGDSVKQSNLGAHRRRSLEHNMDSHGSSLTNSSKQDDEDYDDYDTTMNEKLSDPIVSTIPTASTSNTLKTKPAPPPLQPINHHYGSTYGTITSSSPFYQPNGLKTTIEELGEKHVHESSTLMSYESSVAANKYKAREQGSIYTSASSASNHHSNHYPLSNNSNNGPFHQRFSNCAYDPNIDSTQSQSTNNVSISALKTPTPVTNSEQQHFSTNNEITNGNNTSLKSLKRNNKKGNSKSNRSNGYSNPNYSEHYVEDVEKLLQFITSSKTPSSSTAATTNSSQTNKNDKKTETNNSQQTVQHSSNVNNNSNSSNTNNNSTNLVNNSINKQQQSTKKITQASSNSKCINSKPQQQSTTNKQDKKLESTNTTQTVTKPISSNPSSSNATNNESKNDNTIANKATLSNFYLDMNLSNSIEELNQILEASSMKSSNDEFVTVIKGRKVKKQPETTTSVMSNANKKVVQSDLNEPSKLQTIGHSNNNINKKQVNNLVGSSFAKTANKPPIQQQPVKKPILKSNNQPEITYKLNNNQTSMSAVKTEPLPNLKSTQIIPEIEINPDLDQSFPPLVPSTKQNQPSSVLPMNSKEQPTPTAKSITVTDEKKSYQPVVNVVATAPLNSPVINEETVKIEEKLQDDKINETKPIENDNTKSNIDTTPSTATVTIEDSGKMAQPKKSKYEFLKNLSTNSQSVIFLDEVRLAKKIQASAQQRHPPNKQNSIKTTVINELISDIKFGFMDSSSETEDPSIIVEKQSEQHQELLDSRDIDITFMSSASTQHIKDQNKHSSDDLTDMDDSSLVVKPNKQKHRYTKSKYKSNSSSKSSSSYSKTSKSSSSHRTSLNDDDDDSSTSSSLSSSTNERKLSKYRSKKTLKSKMNKIKKGTTEELEQMNQQSNQQTQQDASNANTDVPDTSSNPSNAQPVYATTTQPAIFFNPQQSQQPQQYYYYHNGNAIAAYLAPNPYYSSGMYAQQANQPGMQLMHAIPAGGVNGIYQMPISVPIQVPIPPYPMNPPNMNFYGQQNNETVQNEANNTPNEISNNQSNPSQLNTTSSNSSTPTPQTLANTNDTQIQTTNTSNENNTPTNNEYVHNYQIPYAPTLASGAYFPKPMYTTYPYAMPPDSNPSINNGQNVTPPVIDTNVNPHLMQYPTALMGAQFMAPPPVQSGFVPNNQPNIESGQFNNQYDQILNNETPSNDSVKSHTKSGKYQNNSRYHNGNKHQHNYQNGRNNHNFSNRNNVDSQPPAQIPQLNNPIYYQAANYYQAFQQQYQNQLQQQPPMNYHMPIPPLMPPYYQNINMYQDTFGGQQMAPSTAAYDIGNKSTQ